MKHVRLVKVETRATFVVDDGETLTEVDPAGGVFTAAQWPDVVEKLEAARLQFEQSLNAEAPTP